MFNNYNDVYEFEIDDELYKDYLESDHTKNLTFKKISQQDLQNIANYKFKNADIVQEQIGDCYFLAGLGAIIDRNPGLLKETIKWNGEHYQFLAPFFTMNLLIPGKNFIKSSII
jgi:hypothetical protein